MSCFSIFLIFFFFDCRSKEQNYPNRAMRGAPEFLSTRGILRKRDEESLQCAQLRAAACCCKHPTESSFQHLPASSQGCLQRHWLPQRMQEGDFSTHKSENVDKHIFFLIKIFPLAPFGIRSVQEWVWFVGQTCVKLYFHENSVVFICIYGFYFWF